MTLYLRPTGLSTPSLHEQAHWTVYSNGWQIGRICEDRNASENLRWHWSLYGPVAGPKEIRRAGRSRTLGEAKEQFADYWGKWLAWAGLKEQE
jgi:hypothetical protein